MVLGMEVGLGPGHTVLYWDLAPSPKKRQSPRIFGSFLLCQMAGRIKMPLGMEVSLGPGECVLDGEGEC